MLEARLDQGDTFKKIVDSLKDLVDEVNIDCSSQGMSMQAMDTSHVSLVVLELSAGGFTSYRADANVSLGIKMSSLFNMLKCLRTDEMLTMRADDEAESICLLYESSTMDRISEFELKLMDIDSDHLHVPDESYDTRATLSSAEYTSIVKDLQNLGETCTIQVDKDGIKFGVVGNLASGSITLQQSTGIDQMETDREVVEEEEQVEEEEEEDRKPFEKKSKTKGSNGKQSKKSKKEKKQITTHPVAQIECGEPLVMHFALPYLAKYAKTASVGDTVVLHLTANKPMMVEFPIGDDFGSIRYYLAPKMEDDEDEEEE